MKYKFILGLVLLTSLLVFSVITVTARPDYMAAFMKQYDVTGTRLATCDMCHINPNGGGPRDSYGLAYAGNGKNFSAIEELDSDGDGFTNIEEISALTFPGDSDDYPVIAELYETGTINPDNASVNITNKTDTIVNSGISTEVGSESNIKTTATEVQSPGFGAMLAVFGIITAFYAKR
ncbi:PGF-CTERM sorting domain-containing protein [Methanolobus sediminis]|uniref:PGF-CTERM sorting domain-containing protein n=1 Tax=Methanolobus sediminis TaxID=3072978 RepID=A0AA51UK92_9EURY|nr:PGF-CTERM sorting domain-containing protein [Methanolobus sediminis]WMW25101.1 PGF-CTERM sorting domain-containing protein [Methanolobus sediminis]